VDGAALAAADDTKKVFEEAMRAFTRPRPRRLSSTTGPWDALRKWMETADHGLSRGRNVDGRRADAK